MNSSFNSGDSVFCHTFDRWQRTEFSCMCASMRVPNDERLTIMDRWKSISAMKSQTKCVRDVCRSKTHDLRSLIHIYIHTHTHVQLETLPTENQYWHSKNVQNAGVLLMCDRKHLITIVSTSFSSLITYYPFSLRHKTHTLHKSNKIIIV